MSRTTKTPELPANPQPTLTAEALRALLAEVAANREVMLAQKMELDALKAAVDAKPAKLSVSGKTSKQVQNELQTIRAFKAKGFGTVTPHENVKTFNRWVAAGRRPIEGSKSVRAGGLRLFHLSQTRELSKEELKASAEQVKAAEGRQAKAKANVTALHPAN